MIWLLFVLIQLASLVLGFVGLFVVGFLAYFYAWTQVDGKFQWRGGLLTWIWSNEEDGIVGPGIGLNRWNAYKWSALRNPCNNLRFVRPLTARDTHRSTNQLLHRLVCLESSAGRGY